MTEKHFTARGNGASSGMLFNSPISPEKADRLIRLLPLDAGSRVLDVGCGSGEFLVRVASTYGARCVGVDPDGESLQKAAKRAAVAGCKPQPEFVECDIREYTAQEPFDCGICIGASHAYSMGEPAYREMLKGLGQAVKVGGVLLVGEGYWMKEPAPEYLEFIGDPVGVYQNFSGNAELAESLGMRTLYATSSNLDEWDDFEWNHQLRMESRAADFPDNEDLIRKRDRGRAWRAAYLKWGRGTMGFGFYLFRREK